MSIRLLQTVSLVLGFVLIAALLFAGRPGITIAADETQQPKLRHVVLFKFKPEVPQEQVAEVVNAFGELPKKFDVITGFEWGTDVSVEMRAAGFTHCFVVTFADAKGRDAYLPHPAHADFVKLAGPRIEKVLVFDFVQGK
jgi:hypothetical protein